jgi:general secretion pathway protein L
VTGRIRQIVDGFSLWIGTIAAAIVPMRGWFTSTRTIELLEETDGVFKISNRQDASASQEDEDRLRIANGQIVGPPAADWAGKLKGSRIEFILLPTRFVFRPMELPRRATEFLDGIVRAQLDRLTPWIASEAAFGSSEPTEIPNDRIVVTVAATPREPVASLARAIANLGADSVIVSTTAPGAKIDRAAIKVFEQNVRGAFEINRVRRVLVTILLIGALITAISSVTAIAIGGSLEDRQSEVSRRIAARRAAMSAGNVSDEKIAGLMRRKHEVPSSIIVLEALSQILPDHTYVTELRIAGDKMQVVGVTRDAPSLIRLIEQSKHFTRAMFFAPTTRSPSDPGERFHIEAHIEPVFTPNT